MIRPFPYEHHVLQTTLSDSEIRTRLAEACATTQRRTARQGTQFAGQIFDCGFRLVPVVWGQSSFMPQFHGRWKSTESGSRIDLQIVPNVALLVCFLIVFAFMGILVYDKQLTRVIVTTAANALLAALLLQIGFWVTVDASRQRLMDVLRASPVRAEELGQSPTSINEKMILRWGLLVVLLATGGTLWQGVHSGQLTLSMRPAVDLVTIAWSTLGITVLWMFTCSGLSPITIVRCLLVLFAVQICWSWTVTVDGYGGDGRPMFAWRWQAKDDMVDVTVTPDRLAEPTADGVDLHPTGSNDLLAFRGSRRDGVFKEIALQSNWEQYPPRVVWQQPVGVGWSSYVVAGAHAVTQEQRGLDEAVVCYEVPTGRECWEHRDRARFHEMMGGDGPRATPTLDGGDVFALGATGILNRLRGADGGVVWSVNIITESQAPISLFGMTGAPLIWNDLVIVNPGGRDASLVAYDKNTGHRRWAAGSSLTAYASPQAAKLGGRDQILTFNADGLYSHAAETGEILWSYPWVTPPEFNNVCQPVVWFDDAGKETVFLSSGYGKGCVLLDISSEAGLFTAKPRWQNKNLKVKFSSVVERDGYVYGLDENILVCLNLRTGQRCWKAGRYGFGQLILVGDYVLVVSDYGEVILCEATPEQHREVARLPILNERTWNHPALSGNTLLIRSDRTAACLKLPIAE